jgi:hypothetical protein
VTRHTDWIQISVHLKPQAAGDSETSLRHSSPTTTKYDIANHCLARWLTKLACGPSQPRPRTVVAGQTCFLGTYLWRLPVEDCLPARKEPISNVQVCADDVAAALCKHGSGAHRCKPQDLQAPPTDMTPGAVHCQPAADMQHWPLLEL